MSTASVWHPISTAPHDGTTILYFSKAYNYIGIGRYSDGHIWTGGVVEVPSAIPRKWEDVATHWMPLPAMPGSSTDTPAPSTHVISDEAVRRAARAIWQTWQEHKKSEASWEDAEKAALQPHDFPKLYEAHALALDEARAALMAAMSAPAPQNHVASQMMPKEPTPEILRAFDIAAERIDQQENAPIHQYRREVYLTMLEIAATTEGQP